MPCKPVNISPPTRTKEAEVVVTSPIYCVAIQSRLSLRNSASVCNETPMPRTLIGRLSVIVSMKTIPRRMPRVLIEVLVVAAMASFATTVCCLRIWINLRKGSRSLEWYTSTRRSVVKDQEEIMTLPTAAPCHYLMVNRMTVSAIV
jgi:hypothetical protein